MFTVREGMQDSHMSLWEEFKEGVESASSHRGLGLSTKDAAMLVAYRERTSMLDHRLAMINEQLEKISKNM